ncbi:MAG: PAS domain-containing protein [Steroidobacteraceae bacterium]
MTERTEGIRIGAKSVLAIPLGSGSAHFVLALVSVRAYRQWPDSMVRRLQLIGEIFTSVLTRRRAEHSLSNSEARLRAILQAFPDLIFVMSAEGVYLECHAPFQGDLFVPAERFLGRTIEEVFPPETARTFRAAMGRVEKGQVVEYEYVLPISGEERHFEARMVRRDDGAIVAVVRNITERQQHRQQTQRK